MLNTYEPPHGKINKMTVHPAKTDQPGHPPSLISLCAQWVAKDPSFLYADSEDWSDRAVAQADLCLRWAHMPFCDFVMKQLIYPQEGIVVKLFILLNSKLCYMSDMIDKAKLLISGLQIQIFYVKLVKYCMI